MGNSNSAIMGNSNINTLRDFQSLHARCVVTTVHGYMIDHQQMTSRIEASGIFYIFVKCLTMFCKNLQYYTRWQCLICQGVRGFNPFSTVFSSLFSSVFSSCPVLCSRMCSVALSVVLSSVFSSLFSEVWSLSIVYSVNGFSAHCSVVCSTVCSVVCLVVFSV